MPEAVRIAKYFFQMTQRIATKALMTQSIGQARSLLEAGFTEDQINKGIRYYIDNPPPRGFISLGYLSYALNDALVKIRAEEKKREMYDQFIETNSDQMKIENNVKSKTSEERVSKEFDFKIYEQFVRENGQ